MIRHEVKGKCLDGGVLSFVGVVVDYLMLAFRVIEDGCLEVFDGRVPLRGVY